MKLIKLTLLAAIAAVSATAFIGASTASALHPWYHICAENTLLGCAKRVKHPLLGRIVPVVGPGLFKAGFEIKCTKGAGKSNLVSSQQENAFKATLEELNFSECSGGCTKVKVITPQAVELNMATDGGSDYRLKSNNAKVEFFECTFGVKCKFEGNLNLAVGMDAEGYFADPAGTAFSLIEGSAFLCGSTGKWESGRTRIGWQLDDVAGTVHFPVWIPLVAELVEVTAGLPGE
jgi:hypothetical protein